MLNRKLFRELRLNGSQFITIFLMVMIAALAFSGVHAYMDGMADSADRYYRDFNLEDLWLTGENFSLEDLETVKQVPNVKNAERVLAFQCTWIREEGNITIETNFIKSNEISRMYVFEGEPFDPDQSGLWLDYYLACSLGIKPGDEIPLSYGGYTFTEKVNGLIGTPDHVYVVKDPSVIFTNHTDFGFAYLSAKEFPAEFMYDQILGSDEMKKILDQSASISLAWTIAKAAGQSSGEFLSGMSSIFGSGEETEEETSFDPDKVDLDTALGLVNVIRDGSASADQKEQFLKALDPEFRISDYHVFSQIIVDAEDPEQLAQTREDLQNACSRIMAVTDRGQSVSWSAYQSEVEEGQTYSVIFMAMFLFIAILSVPGHGVFCCCDWHCRRRIFDRDILPERRDGYVPGSGIFHFRASGRLHNGICHSGNDHAGYLSFLQENSAGAGGAGAQDRAAESEGEKQCGEFRGTSAERFFLNKMESERHPQKQSQKPDGGRRNRRQLHIDCRCFRNT